MGEPREQHQAPTGERTPIDPNCLGEEDLNDIEADLLDPDEIDYNEHLERTYSLEDAESAAKYALHHYLDSLGLPAEQNIRIRELLSALHVCMDELRAEHALYSEKWFYDAGWRSGEKEQRDREQKSRRRASQERAKLTKERREFIRSQLTEEEAADPRSISTERWLKLFLATKDYKARLVYQNQHTKIVISPERMRRDYLDHYEVLSPPAN